MARYDDTYPVDLVIVGSGAGGGTLAQRLARRGWKVVVLEAGPFWDPDEDWVSDEAGSHSLYWTEERVIGGSDPVELGKNNCGHGVGGSMVHYAGYCPRFHPSDFEVRTRDGVGEDWPISYEDLKPHYERLELELPVAGDYWPWGDPHRYPHTAHPIAGGAEVARGGARKLGIEMRVGPVGITNGAFGNRPHCIYRGFCLQGCKVNAKASPLVTHIPDAIKHGAEIRAGCAALEIEVDDSRGRVAGVRYVRDGSERFQRADAVAVAGYSIETPRLLLNRTAADRARHARPRPRALGPGAAQYVRDYNHENRVTVTSDATDRNGVPVARMDYSQCDNDRKNIAYAKQTLHDIFEAGEPGADDHGARLAARRTTDAQARRRARRAPAAPPATAAAASAEPSRCRLIQACSLRPCDLSSKMPRAPSS